MTADAKTSYQLPDLPYDYNALEPVISAEIMELHYSKHHHFAITKQCLPAKQQWVPAD